MIKNFIVNNIQNTFSINFNNKYQLVVKYGLIKYGFPKAAILLILLFL
jgi:hypothetical protein